VLISHICQFIYLKTRKTAGTSVEIYFEPYCVDPAHYAGEQHQRREEVSDWGVVGARRQVLASDRWYNHMPADEVRGLLGAEKWAAYFKFCVVRNPYDKVVSYFWHDLDPASREKQAHADFASVRRTFSAWAELDRFPFDAQIYVWQGRPVVDDFIRYERLSEDMERICSHLKVPWQPTRMGRYKNDSRKRSESFHEYYTPEAAARVEKAFAWEFDYFGYPRLPGTPAP